MPDSHTDRDKKERLQEAKEHVQYSSMARAIVKILAQEQEGKRPVELFERIKEEINGTESNFYDFLSRLEGTAVRKTDGPGRSKLYELTEVGREIAEAEGFQIDGPDAVAEISSDDDPLEALRKLKQTLGIRWETMEALVKGQSDEPPSETHRQAEGMRTREKGPNGRPSTDS